MKNAYSHTGDDRWALSRILVERDLDTDALTRLVTRPVLPVGRRGERPTTVGWRTYRRARALVTAARGGATPVARTGHVPVAVLDAELARPLPPLDPRRPAEVLVRLHGRPLGTVRVEPRGSLADVVTEQLGEAVARTWPTTAWRRPRTRSDRSQPGPRGRATAHPRHRPAPPAS